MATGLRIPLPEGGYNLVKANIPGMTLERTNLHEPLKTEVDANDHVHN